MYYCGYLAADGEYICSGGYGKSNNKSLTIALSVVGAVVAVLMVVGCVYKIRRRKARLERPRVRREGEEKVEEEKKKKRRWWWTKMTEEERQEEREKVEEGKRKEKKRKEKKRKEREMAWKRAEEKWMKVMLEAKEDKGGPEKVEVVKN